jgi:catechol 2,3-dioxygenase-like lactoylglutathione lyase family enzyme
MIGPRPTPFAGGRNIAMKVPPHLWDETVAFYRDVIGLNVTEQAPTTPPSVCFEFGANQLWVDRVDHLSQAEIWLEIRTPDVHAAAGHLQSAGIVRRDEIEPLPEGFEGYWIQNPASIIHIVAPADEDDS